MTFHPRRSALALLLLLAGCKIDSQHEVFVSELRDIASGAQPAGEIQSTFHVPLPTSDRCQQYRPRIVAIFARYHEGVSAAECLAAGNFVNLTFTAKSRVLRFGAGPLPGNNVFALAALEGDQPTTVGLFAILNRDRLTQMQNEVRAIDRDASRETLTVEKVTVVLNNDSGGTVQLRAPSAFVNREPALVVASALPRRSRLELRLSDVATEQLNRTGQVFIATVDIP